MGIAAHVVSPALGRFIDADAPMRVPAPDEPPVGVDLLDLGQDG
jgi:hypothetical protein